MFRLLAVLLALALVSQPAQAACRGVDIRDHLSQSDQAWLDRQMAATPYSTGNHWIASKGAQRLHVVGTMHGGDSRMAGVMRNLRPVIAAADVVFFEITDVELEAREGQLDQYAQQFTLPRGRTLKHLMSPAGWARIKDYAAITGGNLEDMQHLQPWALGLFLDTKGCRPYGFGLKRGLDTRMERYAIRKGVPIGSLESMGTGFTALSRIPLRDQARMLENQMALAISQAPEESTHVEAYFDESVWQAFLLQSRINSQFIPVSYKELARLDRVYNANILDWRNHLWMKTILNIKEQRAVIAVGSAHLPGKNGILNLLKRQGYRLERAKF